jgi:nucleotide-binding universal stress UspA family protein
VAGRQKRDILGEIFVGSTTDRVIRKATIPVLVAKYHTLTVIDSGTHEHFCTDLFRKILYPTDWSPCSERAKEFLPLLRSAGAAEVIVAHVIENFANFEDVPMHLRDEAQATTTKKSGERLQALTQELQTHGLRATAKILYGEPYREIIHMATEEDVSMIVMGSHGKGFVQGVLWGNVSQRVVEYSEKPVLVVK